MNVSEAARPATAAAGTSVLPTTERRSRVTDIGVIMTLAALVVAGLTLRLIVAHQSLYADELSTYWISATHGLGDVLSLLYGTNAKIHHAEISPPLYFLAAWVTTHFGHSPELLRLPSLIAGTATILVVYLLGRRTVGRTAALLAAALTALSPFMIYYSAEARAYALMMLLVALSTLGMLLALGTRRRRWWALYAVCACGAFLSHYTSAFVLAAQFAWVLVARPQARRAATIATVAAGVGVLPWLPGLINDLHSPTTDILSVLSPFSAHYLRLYVEHWAIGFPYIGAAQLTEVPGTVALALIGAAIVVAVAARVRPWTGLRRSDRVVLVVLLALATPVGESIVSLTSNHIMDVRNLGASWPFLALAFAALLTAPASRLRYVAAGLAVVAFASAAVTMLRDRYGRPNLKAAAAFVQENAHPGDVVVDNSGALLTPGPLTALDVAFTRPLPVIRAGVPAERDHPFGFLDPSVTLAAAVRQATGLAKTHRVFVVSTLSPERVAGIGRAAPPATTGFPPGWTLVQQHRYPGIAEMLVSVYRGP